MHSCTHKCARLRTRGTHTHKHIHNTAHSLTHAFKHARTHACRPTLTAYDPKTRSYFLVVNRNLTAASMWGMTISDDVNNTK